MSDLASERVEVIGLDHVYLAVSDFARAEKFYDTVFGILDFRKSDSAIAGHEHRHYFNKVMQVSIRPAQTGTHNPYAPGLHHLCLQVSNNADVDRAAALFGGAGIHTSKPSFYPEYADDYYAIFFSDPDGIRLEVVARRAGRRKIAERWNELTSFLNPLAKLKD